MLIVGIVNNNTVASMYNALLILLHEPRLTPFPLYSNCITPPPPTDPTVTNTPLPITTLEKREGEGFIIRFAYNDATVNPLFDLGYEITGYAWLGGGTFLTQQRCEL